MSDATNVLGGVRQRRTELARVMDSVHQVASTPSAPSPEAWAGAVAIRLAELEAAWRHHIGVTEGPTGLHTEIVQVSPRLSAAVAKLTADHGVVAAELAALLTDIETVHTAQSAEAVHARVVEVLATIDRHRHKGANLVYEAFNVDLSSAD
jgi:hypothetical protein